MRYVCGAGAALGPPGRHAVTALFGSPSTWNRELLDALLTLQLAVAWAGEADSDPGRLAWWRTAMIDEHGGLDLFERLTPSTYRWVVLEAVRQAAQRVDARSRAETADADQLVSLFRLGFALDERLDDRLAELKRSGQEPSEALPELARITQAFDRAAFAGWLASFSGGDHTQTPSGRRLKATLPASPIDAAHALCAALDVASKSYPAPYYRLSR